MEGEFERSFLARVIISSGIAPDERLCTLRTIKTQNNILGTNNNSAHVHTLVVKSS